MAKGIYGEQITIPGILAGANLASLQYKPVKLASTANEVVSSTDTNDKVIGILQNDPADGEEAIVCVQGISRVVAGATDIAVGDILGVNSSGVDGTAGGTTRTHYFVGRALEASGAVGDYITMLVQPGRFDA